MYYFAHAKNCGSLAASLRSFSAYRQKLFKLSKIDSPYDRAVFCIFFMGKKKKARLVKSQDPYKISLHQRSGGIRHMVGVVFKSPLARGTQKGFIHHCK